MKKTRHHAAGRRSWAAALALAALATAALPAPVDAEVIDVLAVYTAAAKTAGSLSDAEIRDIIAERLGVTNGFLRSSETDARLELVHVAQIAWVETSNDCFTVLGKLNSSTASSGELQEAHVLRDAYHADLVVLYADLDTNTGAPGCAGGIGQVHAEPGPLFGPGGKETGLSYLFPHEVGHSLGVNHSWSDPSGPYTPDYSHAYTDCFNKRLWSLVASAEECTPPNNLFSKIFLYSNPDLTLRGGPLGTATTTAANCGPGFPTAGCISNAARVIRENTATVAGYKPSAVTFNGSASSDWGTAGNWTPAGVPRKIDDVVIPNGQFPTLSAGSAVARSVLVQDGGALNMSGGNLDVYGSFKTEGTGVFNATGGTVTLKAELDLPVDLSVSATSIFHNLTIGGSSPWVVLGSDLDVDGNMVFAAGSAFLAGSHTIKVAGDWTNNGGGFVPGTGTVVFDGGTQGASKAATKQTMLDENFAETHVGHSLFPPGWGQVVDVIGDFQDAWWQVEPDDFFSPNLANRSAKRQTTLYAGFGGTEVDSWFFTRELHLVEGMDYELAFDYRIDNFGFPDLVTNLSAHYGTHHLPSKVTGLIKDLGSVSNTSYMTSTTTFDVTASDTYNIGFRDHDVAPSGNPTRIDNIVVKVEPALRFFNLTVESGSTTTLSDPATVAGTLTVNGNLNGTVLDGFEDDGSSANAKVITAGESQIHSISPAADADWVKFTLPWSAEVTLETEDNGAGGDTKLWLYDATVAELEMDDDGGSGLFSKIDRLCGVDAIGPGDFFAKVEEFSNASVILSYKLRYAVDKNCCQTNLTVSNFTSLGSTMLQAQQTITLGPVVRLDGAAASIDVVAGTSVAFDNSVELGNKVAIALTPGTCP